MLTTFALTLAIVALCVVVHYEMLDRLGTFIDSLAMGPRRAVIIGVTLALTAHVIEIYIFASGYYYVLHHPEMGSFSGEASMEDFWDCAYLSFVTYSTLGFGDIVPDGWVRFMVGTEAVTGLVQIAWTASFLYFQMEMQWGLRRPPSQDGINAPGGAGRDSKRGNSRA